MPSARLRAASGGTRLSHLPSNAEVHAELVRLIECYEGEVLPERVLHLCLLALKYLELFEPFRPLLVDDPDAPDLVNPRMTWVHWVLFNLSPETTAISEGAAAKGFPPGCRQGLNDWKRTGYGGPCPPIGRHRYFYKLYALDIKLDNLQSPTKADLERAMKGHILVKTELVGTYQKRQ